MRTSLLAAVVVLASAGLAPAQDGDFSSRYVLDERLGRGTFKEAWSIKTRDGQPVPDKVLIIVSQRQNDRVLREEDAQLRRLAAAGVPTASYLELGRWGSRSAGLEERYVGSNRDWQDSSIGRDGRLSIRSRPFEETRWTLNEKTLDSVAAIRRAMDRSGLYVGDAQVLVAKDGRVVIADPLGVTSLAEVAMQPYTAFAAFFFGGPMAAAKALNAPLVARFMGQSLAAVLDQLELDARQAILARRLQGMKGAPGGELNARTARNLVTHPRLLDDAVIEELEKSKDREAVRVRRALEAGTIHLDFVADPSARERVVVNADGTFADLVASAVRGGRDKLLELKSGVASATDRAESERAAARVATELYGAARTPAALGADRAPRASDTPGIGGLLEERVREPRDRER